MSASPSQTAVASAAEVAATEQLVRAFVTANQAKDKATMMSLIADDIYHEIPFSESGRTEEGAFRTNRGKDAMSVFFDMALSTIERLQFVDPTFVTSADARSVFVEGRGDCLMANGKIYRNRYVFRYDVENGKITGLREYYNPIISAFAFNRPIAGKYSIDDLGAF